MYIFPLGMWEGKGDTTMPPARDQGNGPVMKHAGETLLILIMFARERGCVREL